MNIEYISVSRKNLFEQCQCAYRFRYHLKEKSDLPEPPYFVYGTIVHLCAELYVKNKGQIPLSELASQITKGQIPLNEYNGKQTFAPQLPADYKKKLPVHLEAIQRLTNKIGVEGETEYEFKYDLDPPNRRLFTGVIDRLIRKDDKFWIVDYKTTKPGKWRKDEKNIVYDIQLRAYARVIQREFNADASNIQVALYYLEPPSKLIAAKFSNKTLLDTEKELLKTYKIIENTDPAKVWGTVGDHCFMCEWRTKCPFYKGKNGKKSNHGDKRLYDLGLI